LTDKQPGLLGALDQLSWSTPRPWAIRCPCCAGRKSSNKVSDDLVRQGFEVLSRTVPRVVHELGYSLQTNAKVTEGRRLAVALHVRAGSVMLSPHMQISPSRPLWTDSFTFGNKW
jgi:hypothetical protein